MNNKKSPYTTESKAEDAQRSIDIRGNSSSTTRYEKYTRRRPKKIQTYISKQRTEKVLHYHIFPIFPSSIQIRFGKVN